MRNWRGDILVNMAEGEIIVLCHGNWGKFLVEDCKKIFGLNSDVNVIPLSPERAMEDYMMEVEELIRNTHKKCLIIADLFGGTTANVALHIALRYGVNAVTGLSLQTILIADKELSKDSSIDDLSERIIKENKNLCVDLVKKFNNL